jgi:3-hydroxyisobutyrate dehydrogenase-like beta-hydroxyacid dehydrogenase
MSDITVIGLGRMGAALARTMQQAGHDLTVWNRSPARMQPFIDDGVTAASDVAAAITASPVILVCIDSNAAADALLHTDRVTPHLAVGAVWSEPVSGVWWGDFPDKQGKYREFSQYLLDST